MRSFRASAGLALLLGTGACGWSAGLSAPEGGESIGVEVFVSERHILERDLGPPLSDAITRAVADLVGAPIESPGRADLVLKGEILEYRRRAGVRNRDNELVETGVFFEASARLVDRRTGSVVAPTRKAQVWSGYALDRASVGNEALARERAIRYVAETLVLDLFGRGDENPGPPEGNPAAGEE